MKQAWFQLYHPNEDSVRDDIIDRCQAAELPVLVILADVPTFGYQQPGLCSLSIKFPHWHLPTQVREFLLDEVVSESGIEELQNDPGALS